MLVLIWQSEERQQGIFRTNVNTSSTTKGVLCRIKLLGSSEIWFMQAGIEWRITHGIQ